MNALDDSGLRTLRLEVRDFLAAERAAGTFTPICDSWLEGHDPAFSRRLADRGWVGMTFPARYGGHDRPALERFVVNEELLAVGAPVAAHWIGDRQTGPLLLRFGTEAQRSAIVPGIAAGELFVAIGMSEPDTGSDLASVKTRARRVDGGWLVNGTKVWTSHAHRSHLLVALVRTADLDREQRHAGLTQLIVDLDADGLTISPIEVMTGEAHFTEVVLEDVFVPDEMVIGDVGDGWRQVTSELANERSGPERFLSTFPLLDAAIGSADAAADVRLGSLAARTWAMHLLSEEVNRGIQDGTVDPAAPALVKDLGTSLEHETIETIRGVFAEVEDGPGRVVAELLRQATLASPAFTLRGGTNEILRGIVVKSLTAPA